MIIMLKCNECSQEFAIKTSRPVMWKKRINEGSAYCSGCGAQGTSFIMEECEARHFPYPPEVIAQCEAIYAKQIKEAVQKQPGDIPTD